MQVYWSFRNIGEACLAIAVIRGWASTLANIIADHIFREKDFDTAASPTRTRSRCCIREKNIVAPV